MVRLQAVIASSILFVLNYTSTNAQSIRVGGAELIERDVEGSSSGQAWNKKFKGDPVYEAEFLRTQAASRAVVALRDKSGIYVGPTTTVRFDRMVISDNNTIRSMTVSAEVGALRWKSGEAGAYRILTPNLEITPIGTVFDLLVQESQTTVVLREGAVRVCTTSSSPVCKTMSKEDETIVARGGTLNEPRQGDTSRRDFEQRCLRPTGRACIIEASYVPEQRPRGGALPTHNATERPARYSTQSIESPRPPTTERQIPPVVRIPATKRVERSPSYRSPARHPTQNWPSRPKYQPAGYGHWPSRVYANRSPGSQRVPAPSVQQQHRTYQNWGYRAYRSRSSGPIVK